MEGEIDFNRRVWHLVCAGVAIACAGCASTRLTDTSRSGMEQLLVSSAVDSSLDKIDFQSLSGAAIFVDEKHLDCTDKKYVIGSIRQRAFQSGCRLVDKADEADIVLEVFSGAVGTDRSEGFIGVPALEVPGMPIQIPEIKLLSQTTQYGTAKLGVIAYDAKSKHALSPGGLTRSRSSNTNWTVLGVGPLRTGSVRREVAKTKQLDEAAPRLALGNGPRFASQNSYPAPAPPAINPNAGAVVPASAQTQYPEAGQLPPAGNYNMSPLPPTQPEQKKE